MTVGEHFLISACMIMLNVCKLIEEIIWQNPSYPLLWNRFERIFNEKLSLWFVQYILHDLSASITLFLWSYRFLFCWGTLNIQERETVFLWKPLEIIAQGYDNRGLCGRPFCYPSEGFTRLPVSSSLHLSGRRTSLFSLISTRSGSMGYRAAPSVVTKSRGFSPQWTALALTHQ